ncbi:MAG: hypothetical protein PVH68_06085 [Armatimonadota bacterium]|jgi:hypothetical protein
MTSTAEPLSQRMKGSLGMVIPVWYPEDMRAGTMRELLSLTLSDVELFVHMENVVLHVDGCPRVAPIVEELRDEAWQRLGSSFDVSMKEENLGKGGAVALGYERLLERQELQFVCTRDGDGDHSIYDLPHLYRLARQIQGAEQTDLVAVCGRRFGRHRPLGLWRGEYEAVMAELIWEGLKCALARDGRALNTQYLNSYGRVPDVQSGYKVYSRAAATLVTEGLWRANREHPDLGMLGWGVEIVPAVEIVLAGGVYGEMMRTTYETQPVSTFDQSQRNEEYAREAIWVLKRLEIAPPAAARLLDGIIPRTALYQDGAGRRELLAMRALVLEGLGHDAADPDEPIRVPEFF